MPNNTCSCSYMIMSMQPHCLPVRQLDRIAQFQTHMTHWDSNYRHRIHRRVGSRTRGVWPCKRKCCRSSVALLDSPELWQRLQGPQGRPVSHSAQCGSLRRTRPDLLEPVGIFCISLWCQAVKHKQGHSLQACSKVGINAQGETLLLRMLLRPQVPCFAACCTTRRQQQDLSQLVLENTFAERSLECSFEPRSDFVNLCWLRV